MKRRKTSRPDESDLREFSDWRALVVSMRVSSILLSLGFGVLPLLMPIAQLQAQSSDAPPAAELTTLPRRFVSDEWQMWTSPFRAKSYGSHAVIKYVIPFAIVSGVLIATDTKTGKVLPNSRDQEIWSGRVSQIGASYSLAGMAGATYLLGHLTHNDHARETGLLGLEALGHTQVAVFAIKEITNRERPVDHDQQGGFWEGGTSFPSGHAASSFAMATVFAYEYRQHIAVPIIAYSVASVVAASRVGARRHWVSDIAVGGSLGFLIGRFAYKRNHDNGLPGSPVMRSERWVPQVGVAGTSVALSWRL
jgi:hypothetical protein